MIIYFVFLIDSYANGAVVLFLFVLAQSPSVLLLASLFASCCEALIPFVFEFFIIFIIQKQKNSSKKLKFSRSVKRIASLQNAIVCVRKKIECNGISDENESSAKTKITINNDRFELKC